MDRKLHFLVTSEKGTTKSFVVSRIFIRNLVIASLLLAFGGITGWAISLENATLRVMVNSLQRNLASTLAVNQDIVSRTALQEQEQQNLLQNSLDELRQRSQLIESIFDSIGIRLEIEESSEGAGGPFASLSDDSYENLTLKVDHYLETIHSIPLGPPVTGTITSKFGSRKDPINGEAAFHSGVDIKCDSGTEIFARADGVVVGRGYTAGFGNYLVIDHGHSFETRYLHMLKSLVNKDEKVTRGQLIGLVGNTGRSTGPHLHYEINYQDKAINPIKFMQIASQIPAEPGSPDSVAASRPAGENLPPPVEKD
jgi:murein DD-endopeptidase MepM/ murein hydrolase activator NlpD